MMKVSQAGKLWIKDPRAIATCGRSLHCMRAQPKAHSFDLPHEYLKVAVAPDAIAKSRIVNMHHMYFGGVLGALLATQSSRQEKPAARCAEESHIQCGAACCASLVGIGLIAWMSFKVATRKQLEKQADDAFDKEFGGAVKTTEMTDDEKRVVLKRLHAVRPHQNGQEGSDEEVLAYFRCWFGFLANRASETANGKITIKEAVEAIDQRLAKTDERWRNQFARLCEACDIDGSGEIDVKEAISLFLFLKTPWKTISPEARAKSLFSFVDDDGDGYITETELASWLKLAFELGFFSGTRTGAELVVNAGKVSNVHKGNGKGALEPCFYEALAQAIIKKYDSNRDGKISPSEFTPIEAMFSYDGLTNYPMIVGAFVHSFTANSKISFG